VAIVQVSRITNRKGLTENLPQLAGAELGWCLDSRRLFIGNGTLEEGAPVIGNTEIVTQFSDIAVVSPYTYQDSAVGYTAQTGPTPSDPVVRTIQQRLDDYVNVRNYGAVGDGTTDDYLAINRALHDLYCRASNTQVRRVLFFPAGTYLTTETLVIPTYASLVGEGAQSTIILLDVDSVDAYVAQYGDSKQQTGVNIGNNGAVAPRNITINSMALQSNKVTDLFLVEQATECWFNSVDFIGALSVLDITTNLDTDDIAGIRFTNTNSASNICNFITFDKCRFSNLTYGFNTDEQVQSVTISNGKFDILYQGVVLGAGTPLNGGPTGFRTVQNMFDNIYAEGIVYDDVSLNASAYNVLYNVGNSFGGSNPTGPCIRFGSDNNVSINDMFERSDAAATTYYPRIFVSSTGTVIGGTQQQLGRFARENGRYIVLLDDTTGTILTFNKTQTRAISVDYTITRDTAVRHGVIVISAGTILAFSDDFSEDADTNVKLGPVMSTNTVSLDFLINPTGADAEMTYSITHLA
jgi:hypothetical protein